MDNSYACLYLYRVSKIKHILNYILATFSSIISQKHGFDLHFHLSNVPVKCMLYNFTMFSYVSKNKYCDNVNLCGSTRKK
jgi:hypothetical protein